MLGQGVEQIWPKRDEVSGRGRQTQLRQRETHTHREIEPWRQRHTHRHAERYRDRMRDWHTKTQVHAREVQVQT